MPRHGAVHRQLEDVGLGRPVGEGTPIGRRLVVLDPTAVAGVVAAIAPEGVPVVPAVQVGHLGAKEQGVPSRHTRPETVTPVVVDAGRRPDVQVVDTRHTP